MESKHAPFSLLVLGDEAGTPPVLALLPRVPSFEPGVVTEAADEGDDAVRGATSSSARPNDI
jgi:NADPH-dependent ferric siderophore reductase